MKGLQMRVSLVAVVLVCLDSMAVAGHAAGEPSGKSVTTTWRRDPFPNVAPQARGRHADVEINKPTRLPNVLLGVYDVENDPLAVSSFTQPDHGSAKLNDDGTFTYTPKRDYIGGDAFRFTLSDGRGGLSTAEMQIRVIRPTGAWSTTSFVDLAELHAGGDPIGFGKSATVPRAYDWDGDGKIDLLVGAEGNVWLYRNVGTRATPRFSSGVKVRAGGNEIQFGNDRVHISLADFDQDGKTDLVAIPGGDRKIRLYRNASTRAGETEFAAAELLKSRNRDDVVAGDIRADIADWDGDGLPDVVTGSRSGHVKIAHNVGTASAPAFGAFTTVLDCEGRTISGSYNLNVRLADVNQDGLRDFIHTYNWGTIHFHINSGSAHRPRLAASGRFSVTGRNSAPVNLHQLCDGPIVDFADFNGDGTLDLVVGGEVGGTVRMAFGQSRRRYLEKITELVAAHPRDLGAYLDDVANAAEKGRMQATQGALYDYVVSFATPSQKEQIATGLVQLISEYPQYFKHQTLDLKRGPGMPSLAVQTWLTLLMTEYYDPATRRALTQAAGFTGGYRKLVEDLGLIYADNAHNPRGAEAIYQWVRTIPREIYPGTCITANDWLGGRTYLVRGHTKNTFNGFPVDGGEYGFGNDARTVIGDRGSENWFMTVVHHEASHDLDAYVRQRPDLQRRWGQTLVLAGGPDMRPDPNTGWYSRDLTQKHFRQTGLWDGNRDSWDAVWKRYWSNSPGSQWREYGFMRGNIAWFYGAPQESLATQGNQYWNSTEGRIQVALDRWKRGYKSNLTEVLLFMEIWSMGLDKIKFCENDNACNQEIFFARLRRNRHGYIDYVDLGGRYYEFVVDEKGVVTDVVHTPKEVKK